MQIDQINVFVQLPSYIFWKDKNSVFLGCNSFYAEIAGLRSPADIIGKTDHDFVWGKTCADLYQQGDQEVLMGKTKLGVIEPQIRQGGQLVDILINKIPFYQDNVLVGVLGNYIDLRSTDDHGVIDPAKKNIPLTPKQAECLRYVAKGLTAKQIASEMLISCRTVEMHINELKRKLACYNKSSLIQKAQSLPFIHRKLLSDE